MKRLTLLTCFIVLSLLILGPVYAQDGARQTITPDNASQLVEHIRLGRSTAEQVAFFPDGQTIAVASTIGVWLYPASDLPNSTEPPLLPVTKMLEAMALSPDGATLVTSSNRALQFWDTASRQIVGTVELSRASQALAFSPVAPLLAINSGYDGLKLWDIVTAAEQAAIAANMQPDAEVVFSPDGSLIVGATTDYKVHIWSTADATETALLEGHTRYVYDFAFSPDGALLASASYDKSVRVWDVASGREVAVLVGTEEQPLDEAYSLAFSPDGTLLVSGHAKGKVALWDTATGALAAVTGPGSGEIRDLAFSPDGSQIATVSSANAFQLWDTATGAEIAAAVGHTYLMNGVAFSPDSSTLAVAEWNAGLWLWNTATLDPLNVSIFAPKASASSLSNDVLLAFAPDGGVLATTDGFKVILLDPASGAEVIRMGDCRGTIVSIAFSPDSTLLAEATSDGLCVFDAASGALLASFVSPDWLENAVFSPDQTMIATASKDHTVRVYTLP